MLTARGGALAAFLWDPDHKGWCRSWNICRLGFAGMINERVIDIHLFGTPGVEAESSVSSPAGGKGMLDACLPKIVAEDFPTCT